MKEKEKHIILAHTYMSVMNPWSTQNTRELQQTQPLLWLFDWHFQLDREKSLRVRELELSLQSAESKSKMAEERASRNEQLFNQKLREHSRVQETMTQQTKVILYRPTVSSGVTRVQMKPGQLPKAKLW